MDGSRVYGAGELHALTLILRFKAIGYSLTETRRNLRLYGLSSPQVYPEPARAIVEGETVVAGLEHRRENIVAMLAEFRVIRDDLARRMSARTSASIGGHRGGTRGESGAAA